MTFEKLLPKDRKSSFENVDKSKFFLFKRLDLFNLALNILRLLFVPSLTFCIGFVFVLLCVFKTGEGKDLWGCTVGKCIELTL